MPLATHVKEKILAALEELDDSDPQSIESVAKLLEGMSFHEVLSLERHPQTTATHHRYENKQFKGGVGNLIEERFFGYAMNSDSEPDFPAAGVELKATPFDRLKNGKISAGERLVLTMIPFDRAIEPDLYHSHLWRKSGLIMLVYYERERQASDRLAQKIRYAWLFTPSEEDQKIILEDYRTITRYIEKGEADQLSEGLTLYLGACTKGASAEKSWRYQYYPSNNGKQKRARSRAYCFKRNYMDFVLHQHIGVKADTEALIKSPAVLDEETFERYVHSLFEPYFGMSDRKLCEELKIELTRNKSQWRSITNKILDKILGIDPDRIEEFKKANVKVRTISLEPDGSVRESLPFPPFDFKELVEEPCWEDSILFEQLDEKRFLFIVYQKLGKEKDADRVLKGVMFWSIPTDIIEHEARRVWEKTREVINKGVVIVKQGDRYRNDLPSIKSNQYFHVRPHATKSAYLLKDGTRVGDITKHASELPDGQWMTRQSFWLNSTYLADMLASFAG